jgi:hypothetical protein
VGGRFFCYDSHPLTILNSSRTSFCNRPALVFQTLMDDHVCDPQLSFRINMSSSLKEAAFIPLTDAQPAPGSKRHEALLLAQLHVVDDEAGRPDSDALQQKLLRAVSWGDVALVATLIRTCYGKQKTPWHVFIRPLFVLYVRLFCLLSLISGGPLKKNNSVKTSRTIGSTSAGLLQNEVRELLRIVSG